MNPTSAILLAAGRGKRQQPYTDTIPKPLLPIGGRNSLDFTLAAVAAANIRRVCVVTHHLEEQIQAFVANGARWGLETVFCRQSQLMGSGDALRTVLDVLPGWIPREEPVLVAATDYILSESALRDLVAAHAGSSCDIAVSLKKCPRGELSSRSSVELGEGWHVRRIVEKPAPGEAPSPFTAALIYIIPSQIWEVLPLVEPSPRGEVELPSAVNLLIARGLSAIGLLQPAPGEWKKPD